MENVICGFCNRSFGSLKALQIHGGLKHPGGNKKELVKPNLGSESFEIRIHNKITELEAEQKDLMQEMKDNLRQVELLKSLL